jgi:hypothetical protein
VDDDDLGGDLWRAGLPGRPMRTRPPADDRPLVARLVQPGRRWFEYSITLSALALVVPILAIGALVTSGVAIKAGCRRGWAALAAAVWCLLLGVAVRNFIGFGVFP